MKFLAISGSARRASTNTAMLRAMRQIGDPAHAITVFDRIGALPVFSPDLEQAPTDPETARYFAAIRDADGLIIASPEYVRAIPGGLKNAIDWLVSRDEVISKPIVLAHASHRGDDMLDQLRLVLATVSDGFEPDIFVRFPLMKLSSARIAETLAQPAPAAEIRAFLDRFATHCAG